MGLPHISFVYHEFCCILGYILLSSILHTALLLLCDGKRAKLFFSLLSLYLNIYTVQIIVNCMYMVTWYFKHMSQIICNVTDMHYDLV